MPQGVIKRIVSDRGFGFISSGGREDVFFHHSSVQDGKFDELQEGQTVDYEVSDDDRKGKGPRASSVTVVGDGN